jgi:GT2 family glycosyltransferase
VDAGFFDPLMRQVAKPEVGLVSPMIYFYPGLEFHKDSYKKSEKGKVVWYAGGVIDWENVYAYHWGVDEVDHGQFAGAEETGFATGCCVAFRRDVIDKVDLMDEKYFLYWEDVDWSVRVKKAGYKLVFEPKSVAWHKNAGSTGGSGSQIHQYYQTRNRIRFGLKFAPLRSKLAIVRESVKKFST